MRSILPLRIILGVIAVVDVVAAYALLFMPTWIMRVYVLQEIDDLHRFLAMALGALVLVFGVGAALACLHPRGHKSMIVLLILAHFFPFLVDVVALARGQMAVRQLLPEMLYYLVATVLLVRFFPGSLREVTKPDASNEQTVPPDADIPPPDADDTSIQPPLT